MVDDIYCIISVPFCVFHFQETARGLGFPVGFNGNLSWMLAFCYRFDFRQTVLRGGFGDEPDTEGRGVLWGVSL